MRDVLLMSFICGVAVYALRRPWLGVLLWVWVSIFNPHRFTWGFAYAAPVAAIAAGSTLLGLLMTQERSSPFKGAPAVWLGLFMVWVTLSWLLGLSPAADYDQWNKVMKIHLMVLVGLALLHTKLHVMSFVWVTAMSMGLLGIKGGYFTLVSGGEYRVWGPVGTFIEDNNEFALACVMSIPLLRFLQMQTTDRRVHLALLLTMALTAAAALGSQSRGSFLALVAMGVVLWWRGNNRLRTGLLIFPLAIGLIAFMPEAWVARMNTINDYETDQSAQGRFSAWWTAFGVAKDYLFGAGFDVARPELFARYSPIFAKTGSTHAAHSIYFQVLGNHGFIGLFIFLMIFVTAYWQAGALRRMGRLHPESAWTADLGGMCQVALIGYAVGGAFLSLSYFDLPYNIVSAIVLARAWLLKRGWETEPAYPPRWNRLMGLSCKSAAA